jgi:hypothetical protein
MVYAVVMFSALQWTKMALCGWEPIRALQVVKTTSLPNINRILKIRVQPLQAIGRLFCSKTAFVRCLQK